MTHGANDELAELMSAAQRAAGVLAARHRGDHDGADALTSTFADSRELAGGSLLLAKLALGELARSSGRSFDECVQELCVQLEHRVGG